MEHMKLATHAIEDEIIEMSEWLGGKWFREVVVINVFMTGITKMSSLLLLNITNYLYKITGN